MKLNEWQLIAIIVGTFTAVIALDIFLQYQGNTEFAEKFRQMPTALFAKSRSAEMVTQEMTPIVPTPPTFAEEE